MATIMAFLRALPEMVSAVRELNNSIISLRNSKIDSDNALYKKELNLLIARLENSKGDVDEVSDIVRRLNSL